MGKWRYLKREGLQPIRGVESRIDDDLIAKFLSHVASSPDHTAILTTETSVTYQELYFDVIYWKSLLSQHAHSRTVICLERTPRLVSVLLALQWLGITYIPVDPSTPIERLRTIIDDSQAQSFLYDSINHRDYSILPCKQLNLSDFEHVSKTTEDMIDPYQYNQNNTAYIIYTSGSTGKPKGVAIARRALNNFLASMSRYFLQEKHAMLLAVTTISFDIAALELYLPLWNKKTLFMASQEQHQDPLRLRAILNEYPITLLQTTPSLWRMLFAVEWSGNSELVALCGGEPLTQTLAQNLLANVSALWNMYGPTEATVWCSLKQIRPNEPITIGRPIDNMEMRVMDSLHQILPPYVKGELYIGGVGLANGYVNNDGLTQLKFITCQDAIYGRLYRVGDLACSTHDGEFIVFGRTDNQIKLHGYRIELEEIEAQIQTLPDVRECAVTEYNEQLVAYLCLRDSKTFSEKTLMNHLEAHLPAYMLPKQIVLLDTLPVLINGKINRKALPPPIKLISPEITKRTPIQLSLIQIWAKELGLLTVGIHDDFFELGGHSLLATRIISKIVHQIGKQISLNDFYKAPTIAQFSEVIEQAQNNTQPLEIKNRRLVANGHGLPLHDFQLLLWLSRVFEPQISKFNVVARKRIQGPLNKIALDLALQLVFQKHEILSYTINRFYPTQKSNLRSSLTWVETSLIHCDDDRCESYLSQALNDLFYNQTWNTHEPMIIVKLFYLKNDQVELQVCMSHLIADENSLAIFFQDLSNAYLFYTHHGMLNAKESFHDYKDYVLNQIDTMIQFAEVDNSFWAKYLQDTGHFHFPEKYISKNLENRQLMPSTHIEIPELLLTRLRQFCVQNQVTLPDVLCAAVGLSLLTCCDNELPLPHKLFINTVRSTRDNSNYDHVIGCFLRINPIKLDLNTSNSLIELSKQAQQSVYETIEYQRASSLVKLASVGQITYKKKSFKLFFLSILIALLGHITPRFGFKKDILKACLTLASVERRNNTLINVNILYDFFSDSSSKQKESILGLPNPMLPLDHYPINLLKSVFDVCFHRSNDQNKPFIVITSILTPAFQERFGKTLFDVIQQAF